MKLLSLLAPIKGSYTLLLFLLVLITWIFSVLLWLTLHDLEREYINKALFGKLRATGTSLQLSYPLRGNLEPDISRIGDDPFSVYWTFFSGSTLLEPIMHGYFVDSEVSVALRQIANTIGQSLSAMSCAKDTTEIINIELDEKPFLYIYGLYKLPPKIKFGAKISAVAPCAIIIVGAYKADLHKLHKKIFLYKNITAFIPIIQLVLGIYCIIYFRRQFHRLGDDIMAVNKRFSEHINTNRYMNELSPVITSLNSEITRTRVLQNIIRNRVRDYAHAINLPLTSLFNLCKRNLTTHNFSIAEQLVDSITTIRDRYARRMANYTEKPNKNRNPILLELLYDLHAFQFKPLLQEKTMQWDINGDDQITVSADADDVEEALSNLVDNAIKYGESKLVTTIERDNDNVKIIFDNNGELPSLEQIKQLKETGGQLNDKNAGFGLGIKTVASFAYFYHGNLDFEQSPLGGLRAILTLPAGQSPEP